ncbi:hypothetical protein [Corynebacterium nasicanis]|uniref:Secreted protein n=1 Tax=Corynebacterium nasicanis TaxID=1448267 RepID=A0ABW1QBB5_9CORY
MSTLLTAVSMTACGNLIDTTVEGQVGLTLGDDGTIRIMVQPCTLPIDEVYVLGPITYENGEGKNSLIFMASSAEGVSEPFTIDNFDVQPPFVVEASNPLPTDPEFLLIVNAFVADGNAQASQASARISQILALRPGEIIMGSDDAIVTLDQFLAC